MSDPVYDENARAARLQELLRALAARIRELDEHDDLLGAGPELLRLMGDVRSELFHYEVRCTYESPQAAESRRIVDDARRQADDLDLDETGLDFNDEEDDGPWRSQ